MSKHRLFAFVKGSFILRYHCEKPDNYIQVFGEDYKCDHPIYNECTLFKIADKGIAVIQQYFNYESKSTSWGKIEPWIANEIYVNPNFKSYFEGCADKSRNGIYPTVTVRQIMWALRMKPLKKELWETVFDRKLI